MPRKKRLGSSQSTPESLPLVQSTSPQMIQPSAQSMNPRVPQFIHLTRPGTSVASTPVSPTQTLSPPSRVGLDSPYDETDEDTLTPDDRRLLEVRLLHHFTTIVSYTFPSSTNKAIRDMWNIDSVRLGFENQFLLNAIFAATALHLVRNIPESERYYRHDEEFEVRSRVLNSPKPSLGNIDAAKAHRFYLNLAVRQQREVLSKISQNPRRFNNMMRTGNHEPV
jgi:hypothetical protein